MKETQMTATGKPVAGAPSTRATWESIDWKTIKAEVLRLQMRIAKAVREGHHHKAKALQWLLTHSYHAKLLAIRRVTQNPGKNTPGVDNVVWNTSRQKIQAASAIKRRGYQPQPLRRIYILKKNGSKRPLSIPTMIDRAHQALYLMALEPAVEISADRHAYGFRPYRSCADAINQCFIRLARKNSATWVLEGDIKSCFDTISWTWLLENTPMDKRVLERWLTAGYIEEGTLHSTTEGIHQGSIISPCILVNVLTGLEAAIKVATKPQDKVHLCVYADDFIITGVSQEVLENKVKPVVQAFLGERGLTLSETKTKITHIEEGFDFLGFNIRKYKGKLLTKPAKANIKRFLSNIRELIRKNGTTATNKLIHQLNPIIRGWCNYYRHAAAKETFFKVDKHIFEALQHWIKRRHPGKNTHWRVKKYYRQKGFRRWIFHARSIAKNGREEILDLFYASQVRIQRHVIIKGEATPYDPGFKEYFEKRTQRITKIQTYRPLGQLHRDGLTMARAV